MGYLGVSFGVALAAFGTLFLNKPTFKNMCFVQMKHYFLRLVGVRFLDLFVIFPSMLFTIDFSTFLTSLWAPRVDFRGQLDTFGKPLGSILDSLWTPWPP